MMRNETGKEDQPQIRLFAKFVVLFRGLGQALAKHANLYPTILFRLPVMVFRWGGGA